MFESSAMEKKCLPLSIVIHRSFMEKKNEERTRFKPLTEFALLIVNITKSLINPFDGSAKTF